MDPIQSIKGLAIAGSLREHSYNRLALRIAVDIARNLDIDVHEIDLNSLELPLFNEDSRANGFPASVVRWKEAITRADILLIATPEYNHSIPGVLKNAIDWASDTANPFEGKVAAIFGVSNGPNGTLRAQVHLRQILSSLEVQMLGQPQVFIRNGGTAFTSNGQFSDLRNEKQLRTLIEKSIVFTQQLKSLATDKVLKGLL